MKGAKAKAETSRKPDNKLAAKKKAGKRVAKKEKPAKDPNKPKRPPSAFFVFMSESGIALRFSEGFRKTFKEKHPNNKSVAVEKAPYVEKAEKRKTEYNNKMEAYNKKQAGQSDAAEEEGESDKSKSEVNDDEDESGEEDDDESVRGVSLALDAFLSICFTGGFDL
ncbi:hypothetical protein Syun_014992 [Stephania yunnanensis]|uniref:HMG box domain-containing protein n=1 Tax=Stephania yunnanensis TaxID=152371 RepID=A0AAP0JMN2_9MAGN